MLEPILEQNRSYEMSAMQSDVVAAQEHPETDGPIVQELPPVDGGRKAWMFAASAFILELMVWGFGFR